MGDALGGDGAEFTSLGPLAFGGEPELPGPARQMDPDLVAKDEHELSRVYPHRTDWAEFPRAHRRNHTCTVGTNRATPQARAAAPQDMLSISKPSGALAVARSVSRSGPTGMYSV